jgi:hypothetical protein
MSATPTIYHRLAQMSSKMFQKQALCCFFAQVIIAYLLMLEFLAECVKLWDAFCEHMTGESA